VSLRAVAGRFFFRLLSYWLPLVLGYKGGKIPACDPEATRAFLGRKSATLYGKHFGGFLSGRGGSGEGKLVGLGGVEGRCHPGGEGGGKIYLLPAKGASIHAEGDGGNLDSDPQDFLGREGAIQALSAARQGALLRSPNKPRKVLSA